MLAGIVSLIAGMVAAIIGKLGFFVIFISFPYGYFAGAMILKAAGMKRGRKLEILAGTGMVLGALALRLLPAALIGVVTEQGSRSVVNLVLPLLFDPFFWIAVVLSTGAAVSKIRYL